MFALEHIKHIKIMEWEKKYIVSGLLKVRKQNSDVIVFTELKYLSVMAKYSSCGTIQITVSDLGVKLYTAYGFVHNGNFMQYKL